MNPFEIAIAIPTRGSVDWNVLTRLSDIRDAHPGLPPIHYQASGLTVTDARNRIVHWFLTETKAEWLLQVDDDVIPPVDVLTLAEAGKDIIGCPYFIFRPPILRLPVPCVFSFEKDAYTILSKPFGRQGITECDGIGTGCLMIHRRVFQHPDLQMPFKIGTDRYGRLQLTEDLYFCKRAKEAGFSVWADFDKMADHFTGRISLNDLMNGFLATYESIKGDVTG